MYILLNYNANQCKIPKIQNLGVIRKCEIELRNVKALLVRQILGCMP